MCFGFVTLTGRGTPRRVLPGLFYTECPYSMLQGAIDCAFKNWEIQDGSPDLGPIRRWIEAKTPFISMTSTADLTGLPQ